MPLTIDEAAGYRLMLSFAGKQPPGEVLDWLRRRPAGGFTYFRGDNLDTPGQIRELSAELQRAAAEVSGKELPLILAADQEGGQLMAVGAGTPFPGNLALGAARSENLARSVGRAIGLELAAVGINVNYGPVCDLQQRDDNPDLGTRSFGEDVLMASELAAAVVSGIQSAGVAACAKHFPGAGQCASDTHFGVPVLDHDLAHLLKVELPPFDAAIRAGARAVMSGHFALPKLNHGDPVPSTLSAGVQRGLLRDELHFAGVLFSDAMNMGAIEQGPGLVVDCLAAAAAGADLLLLVSELPEAETIYAALAQAARRRLLDPEDMLESAGRVLALKRWLARMEQPDLSVVGCAEHQALALEVARQATTLVRDHSGWLPLRPTPGQRIAAIFPRPADLTPADTSSFVRPDLAAALRRRYPDVDEYRVALDPAEDEIRAVREQARGCAAVVVGTINANHYPGQAALVNALLQDPAPVIAVALRAPYDLQAYPSAPAYLCTYSIQPPSMEALAGVLFGEQVAAGKLPVTIKI